MKNVIALVFVCLLLVSGCSGPKVPDSKNIEGLLSEDFEVSSVKIAKVAAKSADSYEAEYTARLLVKKSASALYKHWPTGETIVASGRMLLAKTGKAWEKKSNKFLTAKPALRTTLENLRALRCSIGIYMAEHNGGMPEKIANEQKEMYFPNPVPAEEITGSSTVVYSFDGTGGWYYCSDKKSKDYGNIKINISGTDERGKPYRNY